MIDSHCHLTHARFAADREEVLRRAEEAGVVACVTIGTGLEDALAAHDLALQRQGFVFATAGLDPFSAHAAGERFEAAFQAMAALHREGRFVAVGEIGLDYHYDLDPKPVQAERLERQLALAVELDRAVVIHVREAHDDMAAILAAQPAARGVIHSFTGGPAEARRYLDLGWSLAFNGVITFRNADAVREAARIAPRERLLVETDAPYLAPVPHRGGRCEPAQLPATLAALAAARGEDREELAAATAANARSLFGLTDRSPR